MDRGVIVGGGLMAASFLAAVLLNRSVHEESRPLKVPQPPARVCEDSRPRTPREMPVVGDNRQQCKPAPAESAER